MVRRWVDVARGVASRFSSASADGGAKDGGANIAPNFRPAGVMRVLYVIDALDVGGTEASLVEVLSTSHAWAGVVCSLYEGEGLVPELRRVGIVVEQLNLSARYDFSGAVRGLLGVVTKHRPDLLHVSLFRAGIVGRIVGGLLGIPVVDSFVADTYGERRLGTLSSAVRARVRLLQALDAATAGVPAVFVANSAAIVGANCDALGIARDRVVTLHRGRDPRRFERNPTARTELRRGLASNRRVITHVGRLVAPKNQALLVDALERLVAEGFDAELWLVGEGPGRAALEAQVRSASLGERVRFWGARRDVPELLSASDVFAFPSLHEGYPGAVVEAMFASVPVVAADLPVIRELADGRPDLVSLVPHSAPAFTDAIGALLRFPAQAERQVSAALAFAKSNLSIESYVAVLGDIYRRALSRGR